MVFHGFLKQNHAVFLMFFGTNMLFLFVFFIFFDSNLPTTPSENWKMCLVFGLWLQKMRKHIINHTCMELSGTK